MPQDGDYKGREQALVKHFFLEKYLEKVAYHILRHQKEFVYVDGFSGPWKSAGEDYDDTSFAKATKILKSVRDALASQNRYRNIRCLFIEKKKSAFAELDKFCASVSGIRAEAKHGAFENLIPDIVDYIGPAFALTFIDPKGYSEYPLSKISPLIRTRGEVLINFMYDHINRFIERSDVAESAKNSLFGGPGWLSEIHALIAVGAIREEAILEVYRQRLKMAGSYELATSTRILYPTRERTYYHIVYATRHWKGIEVFRTIEKGAVSEQERIRAETKDATTKSDFSSGDLFGSEGLSTRSSPRSFEDEKYFRIRRARQEIIDSLDSESSILYEILLGRVLQQPLVSPSDFKQLLKQLCEDGKLGIDPPLSARQLPKVGYKIYRL